MKPVCDECIKVHGRDTNNPVQCPKCHKIIGCFWHKLTSLYTHVKGCKLEDTDEK